MLSGPSNLYHHQRQQQQNQQPTPEAASRNEERNQYLQNNLSILVTENLIIVPLHRHPVAPSILQNPPSRRRSYSPPATARRYLSLYYPCYDHHRCSILILMLGTILNLVSQRRVLGFTPSLRPGSVATRCVHPPRPSFVVLSRKSSSAKKASISTSSNIASSDNNNNNSIIPINSKMDTDMFAAINGTAFAPYMSSIPMNVTTSILLNQDGKMSSSNNESLSSSSSSPYSSLKSSFEPSTMLDHYQQAATLAAMHGMDFSLLSSFIRHQANNKNATTATATTSLDSEQEQRLSSQSETIDIQDEEAAVELPPVVPPATIITAAEKIIPESNTMDNELSVPTSTTTTSSFADLTTAVFTAQDFNITIPKILSPSALKEFEMCPQSFLFQYILKMKQPANTALAKGSMCHSALEEFLGLQPSERNLTVLHNLYRKSWAKHRSTDLYKNLFDTVDAEREWGMSGLACLSRYYESEPIVLAPNPVQKETWVRATLAENITVRGIVDRLDLVKDEHTGDVVLRLMDYKTGKAPDLKYSPSMNAKIEREAWDQLVLYSLLLRESKNTPIRYLRLIYLGGDDDKEDVAGGGKTNSGATIWNKRLEQSDMDDMKAKVLRLWSEIVEKLSSDDPLKAFEGCNRSFCYCHKCRPRFADHAVWQPPAAATTTPAQ